MKISKIKLMKLKYFPIKLCQNDDIFQKFISLTLKLKTEKPYRK